MSGVTAIDHALPNGGGSNGLNANPANADPGGMTNDEKQAVGGLLRKDEARGAAVHVCSSPLQVLRRLCAIQTNNIGIRPRCDPRTESRCRWTGSSCSRSYTRCREVKGKSQGKGRRSRCTRWAPLMSACGRLRACTDGVVVTVDTSSSNAPAPTVSLSQIDQTSRGEGQGLQTVSGCIRIDWVWLMIDIDTGSYTDWSGSCSAYMAADWMETGG